MAIRRGPRITRKQIEGVTRQVADAASQVSSQVSGALNQATSKFNATINTNASAAAIAAIDGAAGAATSALNGLVDGITDSQTQDVFNQASSVFGGAGGAPRLGNELEQFASFNYKFTLGCLSDFEINYPDITYRTTDPFNVILKSGGGAGPNKVKTAYEQVGRVEYYIDNVAIESIITPNPSTKQTNATFITFQILEPYSMGLFLQTLQIAALRAGHKNYLTAPYVLSVEFVGYDDYGKNITASTSRRIFPLKFSNITFNTDAAGSHYNVEAIPWHEQALSDNAQSVKSDISITGSNLAELLQTGGQSLTNVMNSRNLELVKAKQVKQADEIIIQFPTDRKSANESQRMIGGTQTANGATTDSSSSPGGEDLRPINDEQKQKIIETITGAAQNKVPIDIDQEIANILGISIARSNFGETLREFVETEENINAIGKATIVKSFVDGGAVPFGTAKFSEVEGKPGVFARGGLQVSDEGRRFTFTSGTKIQDIIEELILVSSYGRELATAQPDANGMVSWFKVESNVYNVSNPEAADQTGTKPKVYVYRIIPFKVHQSRISTPTKPSQTATLKRQAVKEYNYIYTGANKDILDFEIKFDSAFFTAISGDRGQLSADAKNADQSQTVATNDQTVFVTNTGETAISSSGQRTLRESPTSSSTGGGGFSHTETQVARNFNDALVNSPVDLITIDMKIMGDPYYIADSGMGNYSAGESPLINVTEDGTMDYQSSEVDVQLNFKTPIDYGDPGFAQFPGGGVTPVGAFSGLYQIIQVTNRFSNGQFHQELFGVRRPNQQEDTLAPTAETTQDNTSVVEGDKSNTIGNKPDKSVPPSQQGVDGAASTKNQQGSGASDPYGGNDQI